jgi:ubiquinone/menaquinone biosynthesis C-methylase UbiE
MHGELAAVQQYWDAQAKALDGDVAPWGSEEFFARVKSQHDHVYSYANRLLNLSGVQGQSLLELGCGIGLDTVEFARHGAIVTALDLSPTCVHLARRLLGYHKLEARLTLSNAEHLPYASNRFDVVVARGLLMFTPSDSKVVEEIFRVLKPGGKTQVLLHNRFSWYALLARTSGTPLVNAEKDPPVNRLYSAREARRLFRNFASCRILRDRIPDRTTRPGGLARLYNWAFVPFARALPSTVMRTVGYYLIAHAVK